jgi:ABC-type phosphate/phosphonate transport system ATPase subunit
MTQAPPAIQVENLGKTYGLRRRTDALTRLSLTVPTGSIYALVGANGAGKTTLIKILMNIFPPRSSASPPPASLARCEGVTKLADRPKTLRISAEKLLSR